MENAYRQVLTAWAVGDEEGALAKLQRLDETPAPGGRDAARLDRAKLSVARGIGRRQPAALLSVALLEQRAYRSYVDRHLIVAAVARRTVGAVVGVHAGADKSPGARSAQAALLSSFAGELAAAAQGVAAADFYGRALALAPRQPAALLGLAVIEEQRGHYSAAAALLETLVDAEPKAREARLRLAINLGRLGQQAAAERELGELAGEGLDWLRSLAAQELAKRLVARGELGRATRLLESVAELLPCDPTLPVQLAMVSERAGTPSTLDLSTLGACGEAAESARARYTHASNSELVPLREGLGAAEPEWRRALAKALGVPRRDGGATPGAATPGAGQ